MVNVSVITKAVSQCPSSDESASEASESQLAIVVKPGNNLVKQLHVCVRLYLLHCVANACMYFYRVLFLIA